MQNIEGLNKAELEELLRWLKVYKELVTKVWKRWKDTFENIFNWKNTFSVEYFPNADESYVLDEAKKVYKWVFNVEVSDSDIKLIKKEGIKWGMKIYFNDSLVDMSFLKFYNLLNK